MRASRGVRAAPTTRAASSPTPGSRADPLAVRGASSCSLLAIGLPIALSMICASIFYLLDRRQRPRHRRRADPERTLQQLYVLLAVPLFILAADLMNGGSLTDRLLKFCLRAGRPFRRRARSRQHRRQHHLRGHVGLGDRRCRGHRARDHRHDDARRQVLPWYAAAITASAAIIGPIIPPSIPMVVYRARLGRLDRLPVPRGRDSRPCCWASPSWRPTTAIARQTIHRASGAAAQCRITRDAFLPSCCRSCCCSASTAA